MKPTEFPEQNSTFAKNQFGYLPLPAYKANDKQGQIISCWHLSFIEKLRILFIGNVWLSLSMFGKPLTPTYMSTKKSDMFINPL